MKALNKLSFLLMITATLIFEQSAANSLPKDFILKDSIKSQPEKNLFGDKPYKIQTDSIPPDQSDMRDITSVQLAKEMIPGWNVGNSLEAIGGGTAGNEIAWGNPKISQRLIDSVKAAGFKSVRIPVAWSNFTDESTFTIDESWLGRVEEVVNYVLNNDMYAIINEHWDNGWIEPTYAQQEYVNNRLAAMWQQIAVYFRDYDDHLLFAGTNEIHVGYNNPTKEYYTVQNSYNQTFVNAVRSTGGRNHYRHLLVQGYNTNIDHTINYFIIPGDVIENRLMVEVHYYDPYDFTLNTGSSITQWGKYATDPNKKAKWGDESHADGQFQKMKTKFIDKGYGVVLGEYGVIARLNLGSDALNTEYAGYRRYYMNYVTGSLVRYGLVPFYWDNGGTGNHGFGIFNRTTGTQEYPDIIKAIMDAVDSNLVTGMIDDLNPIPEKFSLMQNYPNPFNPTTIITYSLPKTSEVTLKIFDALGREVDTLIKNKTATAGLHEVFFNAINLPSGIYFYSLYAGNYTNTKKMLLIK